MTRDKNIDRGAMALTYIDTNSGLMWPLDGNIARVKMTWDEAITWVKSIDYGGYCDWRLPTLGELEAFSNRFRNVEKSPYIDESEWTSNDPYEEPDRASDYNGFVNDEDGVDCCDFDDDDVDTLASDFNFNADGFSGVEAYWYWATDDLLGSNQNDDNDFTIFSDDNDLTPFLKENSNNVMEELYAPAVSFFDGDVDTKMYTHNEFFVWPVR